MPQPQKDKVHIRAALITAGAVIVAALITGYCASRNRNSDNSSQVASSTPTMQSAFPSPVPIQSETPFHFEAFFDLNDPYPKLYKAFKIDMRVSEIKSLFQLVKQDSEVSNMALEVKLANGPFEKISFYHHGDEMDPRVYLIVYTYRFGQNVKNQLMDDAKSSFVSDKIGKKGLNTIFEWPLGNLKVEIGSYEYRISLLKDPHYNH